MELCLERSWLNASVLAPTEIVRVAPLQNEIAPKQIFNLIRKIARKTRQEIRKKTTRNMSEMFLAPLLLLLKNLSPALLSNSFHLVSQNAAFLKRLRLHSVCVCVLKRGVLKRVFQGGGYPMESPKRGCDLGT